MFTPRESWKPTGFHSLEWKTITIKYVCKSEGEMKMQTNHNTYTYTARNAEDADKVVTFTLDDERMRVNLTNLMEETDKLVRSDSKLKELSHQIKTKAKPVLLKIRERLFGPVHVSDVNASLNENKFKVRIWPRMAGLRLVPVPINMGQVDNEDAAEAFVDELQYRKETEPAAKKFFGPFDYWFGWAGLLFLAGFFIRKYRQSQSAA
jgi:hypothetical protein